MTDTDEGKAAIKAAVEAMLGSYKEGCDETEQAQCIVRAYLQALPGWRLVPFVCVPEAYRHFPAPPGLDPDSHE